jgi:hypothetical protein
MTRVFKTRPFDKWMRKARLTDAVLREAVSEMQRGLIDADLGGGLFKKRVALPGRGKRGGARTLVVTNRQDRWFFVFGFEKNVRDSIGSRELQALRDVAVDLLERSSPQLDELVDTEGLLEILYDGP